MAKENKNEGAPSSVRNNPVSKNPSPLDTERELEIVEASQELTDSTSGTKEATSDGPITRKKRGHGTSSLTKETDPDCELEKEEESEEDSKKCFKTASAQKKSTRSGPIVIKKRNHGTDRP